MPKSRPKAKKKPSRPAQHRKVPGRAVSVARRGSTAIVVRAPGRHPWNLTADEVIILKNNIAKNATDEELKFCLAVARRYELDPFQQQIWFVPRYDSTAERVGGGTGRKGYTPQ